MSMLGKILVYVNLGMSLMFAAWAGMLYLNKIDWSAQKGKGLSPNGEALARIEEYDALGKNGIRPATARLRASSLKLTDSEGWRPYERDWYKQQINFLLEGATEAKPVQQVVRGVDGSVTLTLDEYAKTGNILKMGPVQAKDREGKQIKLKSAAYYDREIARAIREAGTASVSLEKEARKDTEATNKLKGPKGLQARLKAERIKREAVVEEYKAIRPKWLNASVEEEQLKEVRKRLDARIQELTTNKPAAP